MGANSRRRREAKRQRAARQRAAREVPPRPTFDSEEVYAEVERSLTHIVSLLQGRRVDDLRLRHLVVAMVRRLPTGAQHVLTDQLARWLSFLASHLENGAWDQADLHEFVRRRDESLVHLLPDALQHRVLHVDGLEQLIAVIRLLAILEGAPVHGGRVQEGRSSRTAEHPKLRQVRALLAKAESTSFEEEAEALMAKAQELIARHSLSRLVEGEAGGATDDIVMRRIWLDAPYVSAKASMVHEVGTANRCRVASADKHGFSLVVGAATDIDAVELLTTSLLVQANQAMMRYGRRQDTYGGSRTRAFRQSFLIAFSRRVGERLRAVFEDVAAEDDRLLPVLRSQEDRVRATFDELVPHTRGHVTRATDGEGWVAGKVAADLAELDVHRAVRPMG